jgi:hypothetical protein
MPGKWRVISLICLCQVLVMALWFSTTAVVPSLQKERLLTPFQETILTLLLRQNVDVDLLLRLIAGEFRATTDGRETAYYNKPSDIKGYPPVPEGGTALVLDSGSKCAVCGALIFERNWILPAGTFTPEGFQALEKEFSVTLSPEARGDRVAKRVTGRILITNYDPDILSNEERVRWHEEAEKNSLEEITADIRPGYVGGEYPLHGKFRLRSFHNVINFLGRAIVEDPEYDVDRDPRTPLVTENPIHTMAVIESDSPPPGVPRPVKFNGRYYALRPESGYQWNRGAFGLLYQLFKMTVVKLPQKGVPSITNCK